MKRSWSISPLRDARPVLALRLTSRPLTPIRAVFAETIEARTHNYGAAQFSFNVAGGRCEACEGDGFREAYAVFSRRSHEMSAPATAALPARNSQGDLSRQEHCRKLQMSAREAFGFFRGQAQGAGTS
ncbi:MAG: hypothetical protein U0894_14370 [Pirellulales bacterium]